MSGASDVPAMPASVSRSILESLPPPRGDLPEVQRLIASGRRKVIVLDDDPTGTQTVHGVDVLTGWSVPALSAALADPRPCFFILTNTRSMAEAQAVALNREIVANLRLAAATTNQDYAIISRSDSTLRGHFPAETDALRAADPRTCDNVVVAPAFFEAGRFTLDDVHYVAQGETLVPAAETEFARDATFGYRHSNLRQWIEEKTSGRISAAEVVSIPLAILRSPDGAEAVRSRLCGLRRGDYVVVNAADYGDLEVFVHGLLLAEQAGRRFLSRTAASYVRVRAGVSPQPLLDAIALHSAEGQGGLVVVGSYTNKTTQQLEVARQRSATDGFELDVAQLARAGGEQAEVARLAQRVDAGLRAGRTTIVFTSRAKETVLGRAGDLDTGRKVSSALVQLVRALSVRPRFVVAKGGITSSDLAVHGLGVRRARILGQAEPGIPVWRTGPESRWPGIPYVVFPGNVGEADTLAVVLAKLGG